jgi:hypothetical protein
VAYLKQTNTLKGLLMNKRVTGQKKTSRGSDLGDIGVRTPKTSRRYEPAKGAPGSRTKTVSVAPEQFASRATQPVRFEYFDPNAREVFLVGTFNEWRPAADLLVDEGEGKWTLELMLKPGSYEYRFVVDGRWIEDPMSTRFAANPFGGVNSVLEVAAPGRAESSLA